MSRVGIVFLLLALFISCAAYGESPEVARKETEKSITGGDREHPNIFLIVVDTLRADHLGCYGYERNTSPNIDRLAEDGVLFEHAISQASWTAPSVPSFLSGSYDPPQLIDLFVLGMRPMPERIKKRGLVFLPQILKEKGYKTAAFVSNPFACSAWGEEMGFDYVCDDLYRLFQGEDPPKARSHKVSDVASSWIKENVDERMFVWLQYNDVHGCALPDGNDVFGQAEFARLSTEAHIAHYDNEIFFTDKSFGEFLGNLDYLGIRDNSVVILISDHGEALGEHGHFGHTQSLYEEEIHVPLIIQGKGLPKGIRIGETVALVDILPTVAGMSDIELNLEKIDGISLLPLIKGGLNRVKRNVDICSFRARISSESPWATLFTGKKMQFINSLTRVAIYITGERGNGMKYIKSIQTDSTELYNLADDPEEKKDLSEDPIYSELMKIADTRLEKLIIPDAVSKKRKEAVSPITEEEERTLKTLGYLQ